MSQKFFRSREGFPQKVVKCPLSHSHQASACNPKLKLGENESGAIFCAKLVVREEG